MSGFTQTTNELLHSYFGAATVSAPVTATPVTITAGMPEIVVPAGFMQTLGKRSSSLKLELGGYMTDNASPTWSFGLAVTTGSPPVFGSTLLLATPTTAVIPTTGSGSWNMFANIGLRTLATGPTSTVWCNGVVTGNLFAAAPLELNPAGSGGTTMTTWQSDLEYYLWPYLTVTGTVTSNTVTTQFVKLYGEN